MIISEEHQEYEKDWWGNCANTYGEEEKQITYAKYMGLSFFHNGKSPYNIYMGGKSVIDIGGGPSSLLLKCVSLKEGTVIDPCDYPEWVAERYYRVGIRPFKLEGEEKFDWLCDEVWCYNVLQHTKDPAKVCANMLSYGKIIRIFEWIDTKQTLGHLHILTKEKLDQWLGGEGQTVMLNQSTLKGRAYYGVFKGEYFGSYGTTLRD